MSTMSLLEKAEQYISNLFLEEDTSDLYYHDYNHTLYVVAATTKMAAALNFSAEETDCLVLSAWFHDVGYLYTRQEHEAKSIEIAISALRPNYTELTERVVACIAATKLGEIPKGHLAALLKDADTSFGAAGDFLYTNKAYRIELKVSENKSFTNKVWQEMSLNFLENVQFYSDYGKQHFEPSLKENIKKYKEMIAE